MSNINPGNPPQALTSGPAPTHSPDMMAFTHPHPVDQQEIQFDISRRRKGVCKFFNSQKGFGSVTLLLPHQDPFLPFSSSSLGSCTGNQPCFVTFFINDDHPEELGNQEGLLDSFLLLWRLKFFVHYTSIESKGNFRSLAEVSAVEYVVAPGQKGFQATEVTGPAGKFIQDFASPPKPTAAISISLRPATLPVIFRFLKRSWHSS
ncbi:uncharacterized protein VP01_1930g2 [Puccinia sorghi]|uniref:CSD domain-containing protein n=1 Tax=Puccinia sorghi TaxID=27349 RepID=A0A0L6VCZ7_9BASI|nr:uncharacterized protein VP01_1930g2 [Puccinia sorghi]